MSSRIPCPRILLLCLLLAAGCGGDGIKKIDRNPLTEGKPSVKERAKRFLQDYQAAYARLWKAWTHTEWQASITGSREAFEAHARADLALRKFHSDPEKYREVESLLAVREELDPLDARALEVAERAFKENQLPLELLKEMSDLSARIQRTFNTFRGTLDGKKYPNNTLLERLAGERDGARRRAAWEALKQVGASVAPDLVALAKKRNEGARKLGYMNYWDMEIRLQAFDPAWLTGLFRELEKLTDEPFRAMKAKLDAELAPRFGIEPAAMMPWHYDNPFFQEAPPSSKVDMDLFYRDKTKEEIVKIAERFYADIGLPIDDIVARSDLYEREGKDQHAFCEDMDREGDVRTLLNIRPTAAWMDTMLHENGHALYDKHIDRSLPFNLREAAHIFTTEGVAMLFGALAKNPAWLVTYAGADPARVKDLEAYILEQRRREQLIFCRWCLVMFYFEKALYEDPEQDLNTLWWDYKERFQFLRRPPGRNAPDWAAKPHFTIAPVYYHNYQLGELFAAQLRAALARLAGHEGPTRTLSFNGRKAFGAYLVEKVFQPGKRLPWPNFVKEATGSPLSARQFAGELR